MAGDPLLLSAGAQLALLRDGTLSAGELLTLTLDRITALNPAINAVVHLDADGARAAAAASDARRQSGEARPLEGLPVTIKDALDVAGMPSTAGHPGMKGRIPEHDAVAVRRLREAGAVIVGKTNVPVFSGDFQAFNPMHGVTNNPRNPAFSAGGSSGGAAAAVATGMSSIEIGTDQGSSIRWPCATNGVTGLKTSWGLISSWGMVPPPPEKRTLRNVELAVVGPIARHAADLDLLLPILAGPRDAAIAAPALRPPRRTDPRGLRVAVWLDEPFAPVERAVAEGVGHAAALLAGEGAIVDEKARPSFRFEEAYEVFALLNHWIVGYGLPAKIRDKIAAAAGSFAPGDLSHRALQARGMRMTPSLYQEVDQRRKRIIRQWAAFFERFDVVLMPCAPVAALAHDHEPNIMARKLDIDGVAVPYLNFLQWAAPAAVGNLPAAAAPAGFTAAGMPLGVQVVASFMEDRTAIAVAAMLQAMQGGFRAPPIPA